MQQPSEVRIARALADAAAVTRYAPIVTLDGDRVDHVTGLLRNATALLSSPLGTACVESIVTMLTRAQEILHEAERAAS